MEALMSVNRNACGCEEVLSDLSGIAGMVNRRMHVSDLHERIDIFFYIDSSIRARELCASLQVKSDAEDSRKLTDLHKLVTERWKKDHKILSPEKQIIL